MLFRSSMGQLAKGARAIAEGAVVPVETLVIREAEEVNRALHATSAALATQNAALLRSHQTFLSLVLQAPFGVYLINSQFRITQISAGAQKVFAGFQSIIDRDLAEVLRTLWPEPFASEAIGRFRHTLATGEPFHQLELENRRRDTGSGEAYDWKLERVTLPDGEHGVVCYFYDLTAQKNAEAALRDSEVRYRTAIQAGGLGTWETDYSTNVRRWTPEGMALFGLSLAKGIGQFGGNEDELYRCVHPEDRHLFKGLRGRMHALGTMTVEYRIIRPDGKTRWISGHGTVLARDAAGRPIKSVHIAADFTEQKEREQQVQLLLSEVNHRAKNMLGLVLSVARQTAGGDNQEFVQRFTEHVHSLAAGQDLLVKSKWNGVLLDELVRAQLGFFKDLIDVRIKLRGEDVRLSPAAAQTIGMALHELATNASKHGALSVGTGQVDIAWELGNVSERRRFRLTWTETNGPPVVPPTRRGFGSTVTGTMVKMSLGGEVTTEFAPSGFTWRVDCPAEAVVDGPQLADSGQHGNTAT